MLEFKNTSVSLGGKDCSRPFSLVVDGGDVVCLCGGHGTGKTKILKAILGLSPVSDGFITIDGEIISPGSSSYFRDMVSYVPQDLPEDRITVAELVDTVFGLHVNKGLRPDDGALLAVWGDLGIGKDVMDGTLDKLDVHTRQLVCLSLLPFLKRKIVLIDNLLPSAAVGPFISRLASAGAEVIFTCRESGMDCDKTVNL